MTEKKSQRDYLYFVLALSLSFGIALELTGSSTLDQIEIFKWTEQGKSPSPEIQHQIDVYTLKGTAMEVGGILIMGGGAIWAFLTYKRVE